MLYTTTLNEIETNINTGVEYEIALFAKLIEKNSTDYSKVMNSIRKRHDSSKVLQKHSHSLDSLMNRNPFGFQGTCNLGLGVPGIDIERKDFEVEFR